MKDADKMMHQHNLPLDYPEFVRAKQNALNASDVSIRSIQHYSCRHKRDVITLISFTSLSKNIFLLQLEYKKQRKEVIDNYRGFQTMDSKDHPVVQQGIKAAELISDVSKTNE